MSIFPSETFARGEALLGYNDDYKSSLLAQKFAGFPKGVYVGFNPSVTPPSPILSLTVNPVEAVSVIKIPSGNDSGSIDIIVNQTITLDFTGQPPTDFPVHVVARASYTDDPDTPTTAELFTRSATVAGQIIGAIAGVPTNFDLSTTSISAPTKLRAGTVQINVVVDGIGPVVATDDGNGVFSPSIALPTGGTVNYLTGELTGTTPLLAAGSFITADFSLSSTFDEVIVCTVDGDPANLTVAFEPSLGERDAPLAFGDVDFGFMPAGSVENLALAVDFVNEVVAARVGVDGTVHDSLSERLAADQSAAATASRLAVVFRVLRSNDVSVAEGEAEVNVSGSFSEVDRLHAPFVTLSGTGSETTVGAVAEPNDTSRNVCVVVDSTTGVRPVDAPDTRSVVFGRLEGPEEDDVAGTLSFINASRDVTGVGTNFTSSKPDVGDLLEGPDGRFYEVESISTGTALKLTNAYTGPTTTAESLKSRRWLLKFKTVRAGTEEDVEFPYDGSVRFFFPAFLDMSTSNFDYRLGMHATGEPEPLPTATTDVAGKLLLTKDGSLLGSMEIQSQGTVIAGNAFHTINFSATSAQVSPGVVDGEVEVEEIGNPGNPGPSGQTGLEGPPGEQGESFSAINTFELLPEVRNPFTGVPVPFSDSRDMGHEVRMFAVGFGKWADRGTFNNSPNDNVEINSATLVGTSVVQVDGTALNDVNFTIFITSAGVIPPAP